jgi:hypothetical protein
MVPGNLFDFYFPLFAALRNQFAALHDQFAAGLKHFEAVKSQFKAKIRPFILEKWQFLRVKP